MSQDVHERGDQVVKRFRSGDLDKPTREWRALTLLARYSPGLAPDPIEMGVDPLSPTVVMSRVPGKPLRGGRVLPEQVSGLVEAVTALWESVPPAELATLPVRAFHQEATIREIETWSAHDRLSEGAEVVIRAREQGLRWLRSSTFPGTSASAFSNGDGNLSNFLWDGLRVRVIDFEYSGRSDRAYELAEIVEHVSAWVDTEFDAAHFLAHFDLKPDESVRLRECCRLLAFEWLRVFCVTDPAKRGNPPMTRERQAERLLARLETP